MELRPAKEQDAAFIVEMARLAGSLRQSSIPAADSPSVLGVLPRSQDASIVAIDAAGTPLGAAWWHVHDPALLCDDHGVPLPELSVAVIDTARRRGVATTLIESLAAEVAQNFEQLSLNVHLLNPAAHLYVQTGFRVAGHGRGLYGVAKVRDLQ